MKFHSLARFFLGMVLLHPAAAFAQAQVWTLEQCMDTAQVHNKALQIARNNTAIGTEKTREATANLYPKLTLSAEYKYFTQLPYQLMPLSTFNPAAPQGQFKEAQFGVPHNLNANLLLAVPLYNPQAYGAIHVTRAALEITEIQYQKTQEQVNFDIASLYYSAQIVQHQMDFIDSNLLNAKALLSNVLLLHEQLLAKESDVSKVKLQISQLNTQKESLAAKWLQVERALKLAMGIPIDRMLQVEPDIRFRQFGDRSHNTPLDINMVQAQNRLLSSELTALKNTRMFPSVHLVGTYGISGLGYDQEPDPFLNWYPISFAGLQLSYPLFNGTLTQRKINQKKLELQNNELQLGLVAERNFMEVENAKLGRDVAIKNVETALEQIGLAHKIYRQTIIQQQEGLASLTDVLLADNALRETQQQYMYAVMAYYTADLELLKVTGNL